jgi:pilus assembly protein FimV
MGLEYNPALSGTQIELQRRPNGNRFLKLVSAKPLNDPFVDLIVELSWGSGRIVRVYTILLDPPKTLDSVRPNLLPLMPPEASVQNPNPAPTAAVAPIAASDVPTQPTAPASSAPQNAQSPKTALTSANPPSMVASTSGRRIRVGKGDTAGKLARSMVPQGVTVDQMLIALLNANPTAFVGGNVNRLKAGAELSVPDSDLASKTSPAQARQTVENQYQAFQTLRGGLASQAPSVKAPMTPQEASGTLAKPTATDTASGTRSDKLKLSTESVKGKGDKDNADQMAKKLAKADAAQRKAELDKNIDELKKLGEIATTSPTSAPNPTAPASDATGQTVSPGSIEAASGIKAVPAVPVAPPAKAKEPAPTSVDIADAAFQNPGILAGLIAILGLGAFGIYRRVRGSKSPSGTARREGVAPWETSANTNFEVGAGQRVDTADANTAGLASMVFPESQLEMVNELDPVAEAEVYLAYGKDVPAEEILKEGLQQDPARVAIHLKLLSIYAKRQDTRSFEAVAKQVSPLVDTTSNDWAQVQEMGKSIDASNPLYGPSAAASWEGEASGMDRSMISFDASESLNVTSDALRASAQAQPGSQARADLGESFKSSKKVAAEAASVTAFDLTSISLNSPTATLPATAKQDLDRLDATLALAEQFIAIDEKEGAQALLEEVMAGGNEALRQRAKTLLARMK